MLNWRNTDICSVKINVEDNFLFAKYYLSLASIFDGDAFLREKILCKGIMLYIKKISVYYIFFGVTWNLGLETEIIKLTKFIIKFTKKGHNSYVAWILQTELQTLGFL